MIITKQHIGKRILYKKVSVFENVEEGIIQEMSPTGEWFKINNTWHKTIEYDLIEVLNETKDEKKLLLD
jgi:hypothetical protein